MTNNKDNFEDELSKLLNRYSLENETDTPDFILAKYLTNCLENFRIIVDMRDEWNGINKNG